MGRERMGKLTPFTIAGTLLLALICGCKKPARPRPTATTVPPPTLSPLPKANGLVVQGKVPKVPEWNRDDPDYVAIRKLYMRAKSAAEQGDYQKLFQLVAPKEHRRQLCQAIAAASEDLQRWHPEERQTRLLQIVKRHRLPIESVPDPGNRQPPEEQMEEAWKAATDLPGCFEEVVNLAFRPWFYGSPLANYYNGEIRVETISGGEAVARVFAHVSPPREDLTVHFVKEGTEWYMRIPLEALK
jgi:hypothetical protein